MLCNILQHSKIVCMCDSVPAIIFPIERGRIGIVGFSYIFLMSLKLLLLLNKAIVNVKKIQCPKVLKKCTSQ